MRAVLPLLFLGMAGCAPVGGSGTPSGVEDGGASDTPGDAGLDLTRDPGCPAQAAWVAQLTGSVVDEDEAPVPGARVQTCVRTDTERLLCLQPATVDDEGAFQVTVPQNARCMLRATARVVLPLSDTATVYCHVDLPLDAASLHVDAPYVLFDTTPAGMVPPIGDASAVRTVTFGDGLEIDVVPERIFMDDYGRLAARRFAPDEVPSCMLTDAPELDAVYAFSPEGDIYDDGFALRIPNHTGLAAGAEVELYALGGLSCSLPDDTLIEEGVWQRFGTARVGDDGAAIDVPAGQGLPCFNWMGYRALSP